MNSLYREEILEHWRDPQNYGWVDEPHFTMEKQNDYCGDNLSITGNIKQGVLIDVKFRGNACAVATASASVYTEYIKNKEVQEILEINQQEFFSIISKELKAARPSCSLLIYDTVRMALTSMA